MAQQGEDIPLGERVTAIQPLRSDPNIRSVRVGRRTIAKLRASEIEALGVEVGQELTAGLWRDLERAAEQDKGRKAALRLLGRRAYSSGQIVQRLGRRGFDRDLSRRIAEELVEAGWIDDLAYARAEARQILSRAPAGKRLLVSKLRQRFISAEMAEQVAEEVLRGVDATEQATALARKRLRVMGPVPPATAARRIAAALHRRGFDGETVRNVIEGLPLVDDASDAD